MLSRDQGLASIAGQLVGRGQPLTRFSSPADVPDWLRPPTRMVVLDYPKTARAVVYRQLRQRYQGPVLALLDPDEDSSGLPTDHGCIGTLHRPFTGEELSASLDELAGSRNGARGSKSDSLTAPPLGADADTAAPLDVSAVFAATPARLRARHEASGAAAVPPAISWVRLATPTAGQGGAAAGAGAAAPRAVVATHGPGGEAACERPAIDPGGHRGADRGRDAQRRRRLPLDGLPQHRRRGRERRGRHPALEHDPGDPAAG